MKHISRIYDQLGDFIREGRVTVVYGPRRVGKTTLVKRYIASLGAKTLSVTGDNAEVRAILESQNLKRVMDWVEGYDVLFIDEAQRVLGVGWGLKLLIDNRPELNIIVSGSASFELAGVLSEPLTGRQTVLRLYPVSQLELAGQLNKHELKANLPDYLVYGSYPEVLVATSKASKEFVLDELTESYLYKDILELDQVKNTGVLRDLLILLARQVGSEVSYNELATQLKIDTKTVIRYIDIFEKCFILYNLRGFSRNLRKEVTKKSKYYFYDNGVLNTLIKNYNKLEDREDIGRLWENFLFMERVKRNAYKRAGVNMYFWRTWEGHEVDLVEETGGRIRGYEFKYATGKSKTRGMHVFGEEYEARTEIVDSENYLDFTA